MDTMKYKGFEARIGYMEGDDVFNGRILGIRDIVTFEGTSIEELKGAFEEAVEDYLDYCKHQGVQPEKSYSGNFPVRTTREMHAQFSRMAEKEDMSLNQWVIDKLTHCIEE